MSADLLYKAIAEKKSVDAVYKNATRKFSPHCIGENKSGELSILGFQYAGESSGPLPNWRCFRVDELENIELNNDDWVSDNRHSRTNTCVVRVFAEVDSSP